MRKGHPLPALPSYRRSTIRNSFLPVFDPAENFKPEAPRINAKGPEGPDRSQAVSDAPPHHVKAGDANEQWWRVGDDGEYIPVPPLGPSDPVPVTRLPGGTVRLDATPPEIWAAARKYPGDDDHLRLHHLRLQQLTPAEAEAMTTFTWGPGSSWGPPSRFFANYDEYVAARESGYAKLRAVARGEESAIFASLSDDVERIKACREPKTPSPDPQCSGPGYAHAPHGNCMGYGTDRT